MKLFEDLLCARLKLQEHHAFCQVCKQQSLHLVLGLIISFEHLHLHKLAQLSNHKLLLLTLSLCRFVELILELGQKLCQLDHHHPPEVVSLVYVAA